MEGWEGKVEAEESREMMVMLNLEVDRRAERIWEPIVPLAFCWAVLVVVDFVGCIVFSEMVGWVSYSYKGDSFDVVVVGHFCGDGLLLWLATKCRLFCSFSVSQKKRFGYKSLIASEDTLSCYNLLMNYKMFRYPFPRAGHPPTCIKAGLQLGRLNTTLRVRAGQWNNNHNMICLVS